MEPLRLWDILRMVRIVKAESPIITSQCVSVSCIEWSYSSCICEICQEADKKEQPIEKLVNFSGEPQKLEFPSAPKAVHPVS